MGFITDLLGFTRTPTYAILKTPTGRFGIYGEDGNLFRDYARRRDATRGAERAGITLVA